VGADDGSYRIADRGRVVTVSLIAAAMAVVCLGFAFMCFRMARLYGELAQLNRLVAEMLRAGVSEEALVAAERAAGLRTEGGSM
jgi:hypothetical protein